MATYNTYIGARYVPLIMGEYDDAQTYEPLSVVLYQGASYTSKQAVPNNTPPTNTDFWALTGNYNAQVEQYRTEVNEYKDQVTEAVQTVETELEEYEQRFDNKIDEYNANASAKTVAFNSNYDTKLTAFNNNYDDKLNAFNTNATNKTDAYNTNAETKYNAYNTNADNRYNQVNTLYTQAQSLVAALESAVKNVTVTATFNVTTSGTGGTGTYIPKTDIPEFTGLNLVADLRSNFIMFPTTYTDSYCEDLIDKYVRGEIKAEELAEVSGIYATKEMADCNIQINSTFTGFEISYPAENQQHKIFAVAIVQTEIPA